MDSYSELRYMETSCQLLQIHEEITSLTKQKEAIERRIKEKQYEEADLCKINLCFIKIIQKTKGADNYSPEKCRVSNHVHHQRRNAQSQNHHPPLHVLHVK